jgi:hypothetical protein
MLRVQAEETKEGRLVPRVVLGAGSGPCATRRGGMGEWFKALVLKTGDRKLRGFESYSLRQHAEEVAEWLKAAAC